jgi:hypothetical protein
MSVEAERFWLCMVGAGFVVATLLAVLVWILLTPVLTPAVAEGRFWFLCY